MNERILSNNTQSKEEIQSESEILNLFNEIINQDYEVVRTLSDNDGVYMLEVKTVDESDDVVMYTFIRAGKHFEVSSAETVVDAILYNGDTPAGGRLVATYTDGKWRKELE